MAPESLSGDACLRKRSSTNLTTVTLHPRELDQVLAAFDYYGISNRGAFFRACAMALVHHRLRGDRLSMPLHFQTTRRKRK